MKIIFLDIDGVLNLIPQGFDEHGPIFHHHFVDNLKRIVNATDAKIVISSTWRLRGLCTMKRMWVDRNYPGTILDITPWNVVKMDDNKSHTENAERGQEIEFWLNQRGDVETYVILDDDIDILPSQLDNFVRTSENTGHPDCVDIGYGLTDICAEKAIAILNNIY